MTTPPDARTPAYDLITMGRSSIDLYSNDVGAAFVDIKSFGAFVGGSPTNIAVGAQRLGLRTGLLTAVGEDPVGDFILTFLRREGVETRFIPRKPGSRSSAVLLGIEPPDRFPLVFYRDNAADIQLDLDDVLRTPLDQSRSFEFAGTNLSREPSRSATMFAAEQARRAGATVYLDLDFRSDQWPDPRAFGVAVRAALRLADICLGTEEEIKAATIRDASAVVIRDSQITTPDVSGELRPAVEALLGIGLRALVVKRGSRGSSVHLPTGEVIDAAAFPVEVVNVLGAGDAYASGLIYGRLHGWDWYRASRMGNACGAIVVTRQGVANFMPYESEALEFIEARGGF
ncbi:MAG: 5-dehydro-2-deoxygluconokinase [Anaerolineales bacterium]